MKPKISRNLNNRQLLNETNVSFSVSADQPIISNKSKEEAKFESDSDDEDEEKYDKSDN